MVDSRGGSRMYRDHAAGPRTLGRPLRQAQRYFWYPLGHERASEENLTHKRMRNRWHHHLEQKRASSRYPGETFSLSSARNSHAPYRLARRPCPDAPRQHAGLDLQLRLGLLPRWWLFALGGRAAAGALQRAHEGLIASGFNSLGV